MYFSVHNENIVYTNHYSGLLEVEGEGLLCEEDAEVWPAERGNWQKKYNVLDVKEGITGLGEGYLEKFPEIGCLILGRTVGSVATTPELDKRLRRNKVLIRGEYNTFAETFAREKGLKFLHCDIHLADDDIGDHYEHVLRREAPPAVTAAENTRKRFRRISTSAVLRSGLRKTFPSVCANS